MNEASKKRPSCQKICFGHEHKKFQRSWVVNLRSTLALVTPLHSKQKISRKTKINEYRAHKDNDNVIESFWLYYIFNVFLSFIYYYLDLI